MPNPVETITALWSELRRRRVVRTVMAYGAAVFVILQLADLLLPAFTDADWPYRALVMLALAGIPLTLLLAWIYDRTDAGVERTPSAPLAVRLPAWVGFGVVVAAVAASATWFGVKRMRATKLDPELVAVLPFRVSGAAPTVAFLREGMLDLLTTRLSGETSNRALDPRMVVTTLERGGHRDPNDAEAAKIVRKLGAGKMVLGEVVGTEPNLVISARLVSTVGGRTLARTSESGAAADLTQLVDRIAASLLSIEAGQGTERLAVLTTTSLPALRAYLTGQANYRRARFGSALKSYEEALALDSSFALAAAGALQTRGWSSAVLEGPNLLRAQRIAWSGRERMGRVDRAILDGLVGPEYPKPAPEATKCAAWKRAVALVPDRAELWHAVGDCFYHFGAAFGQPDYEEQARTAFDRSLASDSFFVPSLQHLVELSARKLDPVAAARYAALYARADTLQDQRGAVSWLVAYARRDTALLGRMAAGFDSIASLGLGQIEQFHEATGSELAIAERAATVRREKRQLTPVVRYRNLMRWGRRSEAAGLVLASERGNPESPIFIDVLLDAALGDGDAAHAAIAARALESFVAADSSHIGRSRAACALAIWHGARGDDRRVPLYRSILQGAAQESGNLLNAGIAKLCLLGLSALDAGRKGKPQALQLGLKMDSVAAEVHRYSFMGAYSFIIAARVLEQAGDPKAALVAVRRRPEHIIYLPSLAATLRTEARLAAAAGDREGAIKAYRIYLAFRDKSEGDGADSVAVVRAELQALVGEKRGR